MLYNKMLIKYGYKHDKSVIPTGLYCYTPKSDDVMKELLETGGFETKPCPYYTVVSKNYNGCKFTGTITDDFVFDDQCKICGEKYESNKKENMISDIRNDNMIEDWLNKYGDPEIEKKVEEQMRNHITNKIN